MRGSSPLQSLAASPTMIGAVTTLIVIVAVFLAYNANNGLPFVPVYRVSVEIPNAARLTNNNDVRIAGHRVGVVESIEAVQPTGGDAEQGAISEAEATDEEVFTGQDPDEVVARLNLKLDKSASPIPVDSVFRVRYRSSFGLKYLDITRGSAEAAPEGYLFDDPDSFIEQTEFDDIGNTFDTETRENSRINLVGFGNAFAARGASLNLALEKLNPLFRNLKPVAELLTARETRLRNFFPALGRTARIVAPVAATQAELFTNMAIAFAAISEDPLALQETIVEGVPTLETGIRVLPNQRPFLQDLTTLSVELRPGVQDLRATLPILLDTVEIGTPVLARSPAMNVELRRVFEALNSLVEQPSTSITLRRLQDTFGQAKPLAEWVTPAQTVCNYWNYWFTYLTEHITERDQVGYQQRVAIIGLPPGPIGVGVGPLNLTIPGEVETAAAGYSGLQANGKAGAVPVPTDNGVFKPYELPIVHGNPYGPTGQPTSEGGDDCQPGQVGYALGEARLPGQAKDNPAFGISDIPGSRGPSTVFWNQDGTRSLVDTRIPSHQP